MRLVGLVGGALVYIATREDICLKYAKCEAMGGRNAADDGERPRSFAFHHPGGTVLETWSVFRLCPVGKRTVVTHFGVHVDFTL